MEFIFGESREQMTLLPDSIDDYVKENSSVRVIDAYISSVDLGQLGFSRSAPNDTGRPMYTPKDITKLYLYGYMNRIRSSRRLEDETKRNLEVMWLLRKLSPDHKTIARFRHDNAIALKNLFRDFVKLCMKTGLYGKELIAIDGSKFRAVNSKDRNFNEKKLRERIGRIDIKIEEYLQLLEEGDAQEDAVPSEKTNDEIARIITELADRRNQYQMYVQELAEKGELQKSLTDPDSRMMLSKGKLEVCYNVQTAVDSKHKLVVDFEATNSVTDKNMLSKMASAAASAMESEMLTATADTGFDSATDIAKCLMQGIQPHVAGVEIDICLPTDQPQTDAITSHTNGRTVYIPERNVAICPMGKVLYPRYYKKQKRKAAFYNAAACAVCTCKCTASRCCRFEIDMPESAYTEKYDDRGLVVKQIRVKPDNAIIRCRKCIVEHPFGTLKRHMDAGYCLMKGLRQVNGEFSLTFLAYNFKRAINILGVDKLMEVIGAQPCR